MIQGRFFHYLVLAVGGLVIAGFTLAGAVRHILAAPAANTESAYFYIEPGSGLSEAAREAKALGLVRTAWHFKLAVRVRGFEKSLFAGEYEIAPHQPLGVTLAQVEGRRTFQRRIAVPEGLSVAEVEILLRGVFGLDLAGLAMPAEGSLLPDTYFYERGDKARDVVERMKRAMNDTLVAAWQGRVPGLPLMTPDEALVLASIVEKETAIASERPLVAAVFVNRLRKKMRLQSDPTVIYGITGGLPLSRAITVTDLKATTPYNTYRVDGLPPTPIANPGREAIMAVLNPAPVGYLYFVADGSGGHAFATTLAEHNLNVARWRQIERNSR